MCQLNRGQPPRAAFIQQLVQGWKELDRRHKLSEASTKKDKEPA
jgi:hypothetical protein